MQWLADNWFEIAIPILAFLASWVVGLWLRRIAFGTFIAWAAKAEWEAAGIILVTTRRAFLLWFLLLGAAIAIQISVLSPVIKSNAHKAISSLLVISVAWVVAVLCERLLRLYLPRISASVRATAVSINICRGIIAFIAALGILEIWGVPTTPLLVLILVVVIAAVLIFRATASNLFAGFQLSASEPFKEGDYIKLESGEEGYINKINWNNTSIRALDESIIVIPNSRFLQTKVTNYGRPLKKANEPFRFQSRTHLTELTGLKAKNLYELVDALRNVPDTVIYFHTHRFLEEHHYLTPEPSNDFAIWISDALGDEILGERLSSLDISSFLTLSELRERLVGIIEEYITSNPSSREVMPGREFYFMKSISIIMPTPYIAHDLREFVESLRKVSLGSLYFHMFESRLRLGRGLNDFSIWMEDSLGEPDVAEEIARFDPYTYSLEGLRSTLIQHIEKRIK